MIKKELAALIVVFVIGVTAKLPVKAAPVTLPDGTVFDPEYYAQQNPDVVAILGTDAVLLYQHWLVAGKAEGRAPYAGVSTVRRMPEITEGMSQILAGYAYAGMICAGHGDEIDLGQQELRNLYYTHASEFLGWMIDTAKEVYADPAAQPYTDMNWIEYIPLNTATVSVAVNCLLGSSLDVSLLNREAKNDIPFGVIYKNGRLEYYSLPVGWEETLFWGYMRELDAARQSWRFFVDDPMSSYTGDPIGEGWLWLEAADNALGFTVSGLSYSAY